MKIRFDDYVERYDDHHIWSTICTECAKKFNIPQYMLDEAGEGICGVKGCNNTIDDEKGIDVYYIDMPDELVEPGEGELELNIYEGEKKMRVEKRMVTTTTEKTFYIAVDGKEFDDEQACKNYELNLRNIKRDMMLTKILTIPHVSLDANDYIPGAGCGEELLVLKIRTDEQVGILKEFLNAFDEPDDLTMIEHTYNNVKKYGGEVNVLVSWYDDCAWCYGTLEEYLIRKATELTNAINNRENLQGVDKVNVLDFRGTNCGATTRQLKVITKEKECFAVYKFDLTPDEIKNNPYFITPKKVQKFVEEKMDQVLSGKKVDNMSRWYYGTQFEEAFKKYSSI